MFWLPLSRGQFAVGLSCSFRWYLLFSCIKTFCLLHDVLQKPYGIHPQCLLWQSNAWHVFIYYTVKCSQYILPPTCGLHVNKYQSVHFTFLYKSELKISFCPWYSDQCTCRCSHGNFPLFTYFNNSQYLLSCLSTYLPDTIIILHYLI